MQKGTIKGFLFRMLCGFFLGVSVIAPGVSSSVMAVMMGIYRDLIEIISNPFKNFKKNVFYLLPMGIGALLSVGLFISLLAFLFEDYPTQARMLFMGLIAGGLAEVFRQVRKTQFKRHYLIGVLVAFAIAFTVGLLGRGAATVSAGEFDVWYLCVIGAVAGVSSMVPGMSVSLVLMLFGSYDYLLGVASGFMKDAMGAATTVSAGFSGAVSGLMDSFLQTAAVAAPVGICFVIGMVLFSKLTKLVFTRYPGFAYAMVFGFMCGTLIIVFPNEAPKSAGAWVACALMFVAGLAISGLFQFLGKKLNVEKIQEQEQSSQETEVKL